MVSDTPTQPRRRARRKEARPGEIIEAALRLFADRGFAATKLEDVAAAAGIGKGTIYLYFPTKEDLFRAVVRQAVLPNLAAATKIWRKLFESEDELAADAYTFMVGQWERTSRMGAARHA